MKMGCKQAAAGVHQALWCDCMHTAPQLEASMAGAQLHDGQYGYLAA
jgi:hypothetical protein